MKKIKSIMARKSGGATVMSLTGFVEPNKEYLVRESFFQGKRIVVIEDIPDPCEEICEYYNKPECKQCRFGNLFRPKEGT